MSNTLQRKKWYNLFYDRHKLISRLSLLERFFHPLSEYQLKKIESLLADNMFMLVYHFRHKLDHDRVWEIIDRNCRLIDLYTNVYEEDDYSISLKLNELDLRKH